MIRLPEARKMASVPDSGRAKSARALRDVTVSESCANSACEKTIAPSALSSRSAAIAIGTHPRPGRRRSARAFEHDLAVVMLDGIPEALEQGIRAARDLLRHADITLARHGLPAVCCTRIIHEGHCCGRRSEPISAPENPISTPPSWSSRPETGPSSSISRAIPTPSARRRSAARSRTATTGAGDRRSESRT